MNESEALAICSDFLPRQQSDGSVRCTHFIGTSECCVLPKHFICELVLHKRAQERSDKLAVVKDKIVKHDEPLSLAVRRGPALSVSRAAILEKCPRLYQLYYHFRLPSPIAARWKITGTAFSECRAAIDLGQPWSILMDKMDLSGPERARLRAVMRRYELEKRGDVVRCESKVVFEYRGVEFIGYSDAETNDGKIYEWKYAQGEYDNLKLARQAAVYLKGRPEATEFIGAVATKPRHEQKKDKKSGTKETLEALEERIFKELEQPFNYLPPIRRTDLDIDGILDQMIASWSLRTEWARMGYPARYGMQCDDCEYRPLCKEHIDRPIGCDAPICSTRSMCEHIKKFAATQLPVLPQPNPATTKELTNGEIHK